MRAWHRCEHSGAACAAIFEALATLSLMRRGVSSRSSYYPTAVEASPRRGRRSQAATLLPGLAPICRRLGVLWRSRPAPLGSPVPACLCCKLDSPLAWRTNSVAVLSVALGGAGGFLVWRLPTASAALVSSRWTSRLRGWGSDTAGEAGLRFQLCTTTAVHVGVVSLLKVLCCGARLPSRDAPKETSYLESSGSGDGGAQHRAPS